MSRLKRAFLKNLRIIKLLGILLLADLLCGLISCILDPPFSPTFSHARSILYACTNYFIQTGEYPSSMYNFDKEIQKKLDYIVFKEDYIMIYCKYSFYERIFDNMPKYYVTCWPYDDDNLKNMYEMWCYENNLVSISFNKITKKDLLPIKEKEQNRYMYYRRLIKGE